LLAKTIPRRITIGVQDLERLFPITYFCRDFCKEHNLPYTFKADLGSYETGIEFMPIDGVMIRCIHPPRSKNWNESKTAGNEIKCPDLLDYSHKLIIEMEEETGPRKPGAKYAKKGTYRTRPVNPGGWLQQGNKQRVRNRLLHKLL